MPKNTDIDITCVSPAWEKFKLDRDASPVREGFLKWAKDNGIDLTGGEEVWEKYWVCWHESFHHTQYLIMDAIKGVDDV